jgi:Sigma-70 region 2
MKELQEPEIVERFFGQADEDSYDAVFRVFSPQLVGFFRRRGFENDIAEDLAQEVMLTVYRKAGQVRNHKLFRAWLFKVARIPRAGTTPSALGRCRLPM